MSDSEMKDCKLNVLIPLSIVSIERITYAQNTIILNNQTCFADPLHDILD